MKSPFEELKARQMRDDYEGWPRWLIWGLALFALAMMAATFLAVGVTG